MTTETQKTFTGWHMIGWLSGFFVVIAIVNAIYVYVAMDSWSGIESKDAYTAGLAYNDILDEKEAQASLGWQSALRAEPLSDGTYRLVAQFQNRLGSPLEYLSVTADVRRPTHEGYDRELELEPQGEGLYAAPLDLALKGIWDVTLHATKGDQQRFMAKSRITIE